MSRPTIEQKFWSRVKKSNGCWEWIGLILNTGYGQISWKGKDWSAHRVAWILTNGEIPPGLYICHKCDNRKCVRPDHLFAGTQRENIDDMVAKGRSLKGDRNPARRHPERMPRGENHGLRKNPMRAARGTKNGNSRLSEADVLSLRADRKLGLTYDALASKYEIDRTTVMQIARRITWRHLPDPDELRPAEREIA